MTQSFKTIDDNPHNIISKHAHNFVTMKNVVLHLPELLYYNSVLIVVVVFYLHS